MRFGLIDRVVELQPRERIVAVKAVTLAEEYLADHFPTFPVLPGVFMLEAMVEAAAWLVRDAQDFARTVILLESVRGVTYKSFVAPGHVLRVEVSCRDLLDESSRFSGVGFCEGAEVVKGRFTLKHFSPADISPRLRASEDQMIDDARKRWSILRCGASTEQPA